MSRYVIGTVAQLEGVLTLNGVKLGQPELSVMTRIFAGSIFVPVGIIRREGVRGRPSTVWQVDTETAAWFEVSSDSSITTNEYAMPAIAA